MKELVRSKDCAQKYIKIISGQFITRKACKIVVPERYMTRGLGQIGLDIFCFGFFPIIFDTNEYSIFSACSLVELNPFRTSKVQIDDIDFYQFEFREGDVIIKRDEVMKKEDFMFNIIDEFILKGNIPWYASYEDVLRLFDTAESHAGSTAANNQEVIELLWSMISRTKDDRNKLIRNTIKKYDETTADKIEFVPLSSIYYSVNSTVNKISGAYFKDGVVSALTTPTTRKDKIESILTA